MPTAAYVKIYQFVEDLGRGVHNLETNAIKMYLSNTAPNQSTMAVKADAAEIAAGNGYSAGGVDIAATYSESGGIATLAGTDQVITASGGAIPTWRYVYLYNDTPSSPADPLIACFDYGAAVNLGDTESITIDIGAALAQLQ